MRKRIFSLIFVAAQCEHYIGFSMDPSGSEKNQRTSEKDHRKNGKHQRKLSFSLEPLGVNTALSVGYFTDGGGSVGV